MLAVCYILIVVFLPHIRLDVVAIGGLLNKIVNVCFQLALSFISAYVFWMITVVYKERSHRAKSQWWIDNYLLQLCNSARDLLVIVGKDKRYNIDHVRQHFLTPDKEEKEDNRKALNQSAEKIANMALSSLNTSAPLSEVEIKLSGEIYTVCKSLKENSDLEIIEDNIHELFEQINRLEKLANTLDGLATKSVKNKR